MVDPLQQYGVVHLRCALNEEEQHQLFAQIKDCFVRKSCRSGYGNFLVSGNEGATRNDSVHELGDMLFARVAGELAQLTEEQLALPAWKRMVEAYSGNKPVVVHHVSGVNYSATGQMSNHIDCDRPLYTMSLALGDACDFTVGKPTAKPHRHENSGMPVTIRMESGDALFFDGGSVPHAVDRIHKDSAPKFWKRANLSCARVSILFREPGM
eukprot:gb/GFBE01030814.1/.p1 GENE.gb/GFBE01030814.1/~~gb/GFBE01030814.1/.p1  ORF type:complete len:211 (+),score=33.27 gb/GFBE01030814.1/:1-633(+)